MEIKEKLWLLGAGRRSERTVFEQRFLLDAEELTALKVSGSGLCRQLRSKLQEIGIEDSGMLPDFQWNSSDHQLSFCLLFTKLAITLQAAAGHRVREFGAMADGSGNGCWLWFEYEHDAVAAAAVVLALNMLAELEPTIKLPDFEGEAVELEAVSWQHFLAVAEPRILPIESEAIINAARRQAVPCVRLERIPYQGVEGTFRIRKNGLLKLGHGPYQVIVDGSVCVTHSEHLLPLLNDRKARRNILVQQDIPVPTIDEQAGNCLLTKHALRCAERIGYPVLLSASSSSGTQYSWPDIHSPDELRSKLDQARRYGAEVHVEASVPGDDWQVLMVGTGIFAVLCNETLQSLECLDSGTRQRLESLAGRLQSGILRIHLRTDDVGSSLESRKGAVLDFDLAPRVDHFLKDYPGAMIEVADGFVSHLFPPGAKSRIPIVSVTGTNGKTTTCRMTEAIARQSGFSTGMVTTGGISYNGVSPDHEDTGGRGRQFQVFERKEVDFAILEEYFGSILHNGFSEDYSDIGVCTNVSEDHLGSLGVYTVEGIAATKALVIKRARLAAVLNADNRFSLEMMSNTRAQNIGLVSLQKSRRKLQELLDRPGCVCVLENLDGIDCLVIYQGEERITVGPVSKLPSSFEGKAVHNIANAMQAALACHFLGIDAKTIHTALAGFKPDFETSMGRLNMLPGLPFQFLMDYAHNLDGFKVLTHFTNQLDVTGQRIICLPFSGDRQNREIKQAVAFMAPHFDRFLCGRYATLRGREPNEIGQLISQYLQEAGIDVSRIQELPDRDSALKLTLEAASPGDLVVYLAGSGEFTRIWEKMNELKKCLEEEPDLLASINRVFDSTSD